MTVEELIKILQQFDPKCNVFINYKEDIQYVQKCSEQNYIRIIEGEAGSCEYIRIVSKDWV